MTPSIWRTNPRNPQARTPHEYELARMTLALRYGTRLPKIKKPKIAPPGFTIDHCEFHCLFSPDGKYLLTPSPGRDALWDVNTGEKLVRLRGVAHQGYFVFSPDSKILLARNEQGLFARFSVPSGELMGTCKHPEQWRLDGTGTLIPEANLILQLAYEGKLLVMNADTGKIFMRKQLDSSGYSGEIYWLPESQEVLIAQSAVSGATSSFWRWRWPLERNEPERLASNFSSLESSLVRGKGIILLHHVVGQDGQLDQWDIARAQIVNSMRCGHGIISKPSVSFDGKAFAISANVELELYCEGERHRIKGAKGACFHPTRDLVAINGDCGFVAPLAAVLEQKSLLHLVSDQNELSQRGYSRLAFLRAEPVRLVVWQRKNGDFLIEREHSVGRQYFVLRPCAEVCASGLAQALWTANQSTDVSSPDTGEPRSFHPCVFKPPEVGLVRAVVVAFSYDAIELWPLHIRSGKFQHEYYPVAAIPADSTPEFVALSVHVMLV